MTSQRDRAGAFIKMVDLKNVTKVDIVVNTEGKQYGLFCLRPPLLTELHAPVNVPDGLIVSFFH